MVMPMMTSARCTSMLAMLLLAHAAAASQGRFDFEVLLDARPIGTHRFDVQRAADGTQQVTSLASFDVKFFGIVAYRYRHQATERWAQGCLAQIDASTNDNGRHLHVRGSARSGGFHLEHAQPAAARDACVASYAYWDPERLLRQRELLNPQTGKFDPVQVELVGEETLVVRGAPLRADRYRLRSGEMRIDLWYSKAGEWLQLDSSTSTKRQLRYRLRG